MNPNNPGGDPSYPGDPNNPPSFPQQPLQQPGYPQQPPQYPPQPGYGQQPPPYQPPIYNQAPPQQPYPQPYPPQQPPYPQQPVKKSNRGWIIGCSIAAVVVLLICGGIGVALYIGGRAAGDRLQSAGNQIAVTAQVALFCTDVESQNYGSAYQLLSSAKQGSVSQDQFTTHAAALDSSDGSVTTCDIDPSHTLPTMSSDGKSATVQLQVARGSNANLATGTMTLVYENSQWKVDSSDSALKLP